MTRPEDDGVDGCLAIVGSLLMSLVYAAIAVVAIHFIRKYW